MATLAGLKRGDTVFLRAPDGTLSRAVICRRSVKEVCTQTRRFCRRTGLETPKSVRPEQDRPYIVLIPHPDLEREYDRQVRDVRCFVRGPNPVGV